MAHGADLGIVEGFNREITGHQHNDGRVEVVGKEAFQSQSETIYWETG